MLTDRHHGGVLSGRLSRRAAAVGSRLSHTKQFPSMLVVSMIFGSFANGSWPPESALGSMSSSSSSLFAVSSFSDDFFSFSFSSCSMSLLELSTTTGFSRGRNEMEVIWELYPPYARWTEPVSKSHSYTTGKWSVLFITIRHRYEEWLTTMDLSQDPLTNDLSPGKMVSTETGAVCFQKTWWHFPSSCRTV